MNLDEGARPPGGGPFTKRLSTGLWELRTSHRVLGVYVSKRQADNALKRLRRRGRRCYDIPAKRSPRLFLT
jgi:hypothetical protein